MELKDQATTPTLAHKLGDIPPVSGLLRRIAQLSGAGERVAEWLFKVVIARGAKSQEGIELFFCFRRLETSYEVRNAEHFKSIAIIDMNPTPHPNPLLVWRGEGELFWGMLSRGGCLHTATAH